MIPDTHSDLLRAPVHGVLTTLMPDGMPQSSIVWVDYDGQCLLLNTTLERQKGRNMQADPKVTVLVIDPNDSSRWVEVRGTVIEMTREGAEEHADKLTQRYCPHKKHFYGDIYPVEQRAKETRVVVRIRPLKVTWDAIFRTGDKASAIL
ncbi:MAG TPA: PPOX class F420-dependent oxidoreductase [Anaerolineales bacterium]|nr:PPOX class F420-dependent oxidoreductase [Anaerolineales bacterium]